MNLGQMRARVYRMVGEKPDAPKYLSASLVNEHLNDAYVEFAMLSGALEVRQGVHSVASQAEYALPDIVSRVFRLSYDQYALSETSQRELDDQDPYHRTRTGQPESYTKDRMNERRVRLYPIPSVGGGGTEFDQLGTFSGEAGEVVEITGDDTYAFDNEIGCLVNVANSQFDGEYGIVVDFDLIGSVGVLDIEAWAKKAPKRLVADDDVPELPIYSHLGIAYAGAARVLQARTEIRNMELASAYEAFAQDYVRHLVRIANNRQPERVQRVGDSDRVRTFRLTRDTEIPQP